MSNTNQNDDVVIRFLDQSNEVAKCKVARIIKDRDDSNQVIQRLDKNNRGLEQELSYATSLKMRANDRADVTLTWMIISWIIVVFLVFFSFTKNATAARFEIANDGPVIGYFAGQSADYDNVIRISSINLSAVNGFHNHRSELGQSINFGNGIAGSDVVFSDQVINTGDFWFSRQSLNSDGQDHLFYSSFMLPDGTPALLVGFEDLKGLGDNDKNDVMAVFTNVQVMTPVPEPETYMMLIVGLMLVFVSIRGIGTRRLDMNF